MGSPGTDANSLTDRIVALHGYDGRMADERRLPYRSKVDVVYDEVRARIVEGELRPATAINQERLASELGISTTPIREALRRLESEGLVRPAAHREVVVTPLDPDEMVAVYEVRETLDAMAARLAAEHCTDEDRERIEQAMRGVADAADEDVVRANRALHSAIYRASHNPVLVELLESLWDRSERYRRFVIDIAVDADARGEHAALTDAVLSGHAAEAERLMRAHVRATREMLEQRLDSSPEPLAGGPAL